MWAVYIDNRLYLRLTTKRLLEFVYYIRNPKFISKATVSFFNTRKSKSSKDLTLLVFEVALIKGDVKAPLKAFKNAFSDILMDAALGLLQNDLQKRHDL
jgi:hypothetical protein